MQFVVDSPAWKLCANINLSFTLERRNVWMALSVDGLNLFSMKSSCHSTWHVLILLYNLLPLLVTKMFFVSLSILISCEESTTNDNIDIYIQPLLEEVLQLWSGVRAFNASATDESRTFLMRGMLLWTISNFRTYGLISRQQTKDYHACPVCGWDLDWRLASRPKSNKIVHLGARGRLCDNHLLWLCPRFNGKGESGRCPQGMSIHDVLQFAEEQEEYLRRGGKEDGPNNPVKKHRVKQKKIFFQLLYWNIHAALYSSHSRCHVLQVHTTSIEMLIFRAW